MARCLQGATVYYTCYHKVLCQNHTMAEYANTPLQKSDSECVSGRVCITLTKGKGHETEKRKNNQTELGKKAV